MKAWLRALGRQNGFAVAFVALGVPAAVLGGIFVDSVTAAWSWAIIAACLLVALASREYFFASDARLTPGQLQEAANEELVKTRSVLSRLTEADRVNFVEDVAVTHHIPFAGVEYSEREATTFVSPGDTLHWRRLSFIKHGGPGGAFTLNYARSGNDHMDPCVVSETQTKCDMVFVLNPPLQCQVVGGPPASRTWTVSWSRPGTWDDLRRDGESYFTFRNKKAANRVSVVLIFSGWKHPPVDLFNRTPNVGTVEVVDTARGREVTWTVDNPVPHLEYKAWVRAT